MTDIDAAPLRGRDPIRHERCGRRAGGSGWPGPVIVLGAVAVTGLLGWWPGLLAGALGLVFPLGYFTVCLLAVALVRAAAVTVAAVAPPVVAALGLVIAAVLLGDATSSTLFVLAVLAPLADMFWWILAATGGCLLLGLLRGRRLHPRRRPGTARRGSGAA